MKLYIKEMPTQRYSILYQIRPLQFNSLFDVNFFFQSEEGMRQTNKTPTIKQDEFHRFFLYQYAIV